MRRTVTALVLVIMISAGLVLASITQIWRQDSTEEFEKGTPTNITIRSDGQLQLAPRLEAIYEATDAFFWAVAEDSKGRVFVGGGNDGKVYAYAKGKGSVFFDASEMEVHALALDAQDNLYVGTSPDGKIYRVAPDGSSRIFYEPGVKYIWALVVDSRGNLFVGTGESGKIFRVDPQGSGKVLFSSQEKHIRCLAFDPKGNLLAGSESQARIFRFSSDGRPSILYDAPAKEITSIVVAEDGSLYAAGIGKKEEKPTTPPSLPPRAPSLPTGIPTGPAGQAIQSVVQEAIRRPAGSEPREKAESPGSEIYRIAPDGYPRQIWRSDKATVFSLALNHQGSLLAGTGDKGLIYRVESDGARSSILTRTEPSQVTALLRGRNRQVVYAVTSNLTKVYELKPDYALEGSFESQVKDTVTFSRWGRMQWRSVAGPKAGVRILTRSGNTGQPDNTWEDWSELRSDAGGQTVTSAPGRFIQWKLVLSATNSKESPVIDSVELAYLPRNEAPRIESVTLQPPDIAFVPMPSYEMGQQVSVPMGGGTAGSRTAPAMNASAARHRAAALMPPRQMIKEGYRTVTWSLRDPNEDELLVSLYIRGEGETEWKLLKDRIEENFYSFDTRALPDGNYTVRLVASDARSNPPDMAEKTERVTERFDIDNTAPLIAGLTAQAEAGGKVHVRFTASDTATPISEASYIVDNGEAHLMLSTDGILDRDKEAFDVVISGLSPGEHTIVVRVKDGADNQASAKAVVNLK